MGCGKSKHADVANENTVLKRKTSTVQSKRRKEIKTEIIKNNIDDDVILSRVVEKEGEIVKEVGGSKVVKDVQEEKALEKSKENGGAMEKKEEIISEGRFEKSVDGREDSLIKENEQNLKDAPAEVREPATKENKAMLENLEGERDDSLNESDQKVNVALEKKTKAEDSECGKGDSSQKVDNDAAEVKEPKEGKREENATVDVSMEEETLVKEEDDNKDMEALTSESEENVVEAEDIIDTNIVSAFEDEDKDLKAEKLQSENSPTGENVKTK